MRRMGIRLGATAVATLSVAAVAFAVSTPIEDVELEADGGDATFTYDDGDVACIDGNSDTSDGNQPFALEDASNTAVGGDAFDGAFAVYVNDVPFRDADGNGNLVGEQLKVGPRQTGGFKVSQTHRALPGSETLRALIKLKNPSRKAKRRNVLVSIEFGSDENTHVIDSSSGNRRFTRADRWGLTADDVVNADLSDPPVITATRGKGDVLKPFSMTHFLPADDAENTDSTDCVNHTYNVRLGKRKSGYLLYFVELGESLADAQGNTGKYNRRKLNGALKAGLSRRVKQKILNWDLVG